MPDEKCPEHDKCFDDIDKKLTEILIRLEKGTGNFGLLEHRVNLLERIGFGLVALICTAVGAGLMGLLLKLGKG